MKPRKGDTVMLAAPLDGYAPDHEFIVDVNRRGLPAPYYLDDQRDDNPYHTGPFRAEDLVVVKRR